MCGMKRVNDFFLIGSLALDVVFVSIISFFICALLLAVVAIT